MLRRVLVLAAAVAAAVFAAAPAQATPNPDHGTLTPDANNQGKLTYSGTITAGTAASGTTDDCFTADGHPDDLSGCEFFNLDVNVPSTFYDRLVGGVQVSVTGFAPFDLDLGVYKRNDNGTKGSRRGSSGNLPGEDERTTIGRAAGKYIIALVPYAAPPGTSYTATVEFLVKPGLGLPALNERAPAGLFNYRASHDQYNSHSEPSIAMDPLNHNHLLAGSKMYEDLEHYLFKAGTYESFDGGKTWQDQGQLPGYCVDAGQCDPSNEDKYRTVSDISMAFDDEGNGYAQVLDAPGGTKAFTGFNMTVHIKKPGQPWTGPIVVHDNRQTEISRQLLLDDKNWIAVDNVTDVNGGPNKPHDGKIGTMYVCWGLDGSQAPAQQIVIMRSVDAGKTWGGFAPNDNTPYQLSSKGAISGIGCHVIIGPKGEVYATWYDNQLDSLMQAKSTDRGRSFTPARPIAMITGVNAAFEGQSFRNLSIPTTAIDSKGNIYIAVASQNGEGSPVLESTLEGAFEQAKRWASEKRLGSAETEAEGDEKPGSGSDIILFKSTDGGQSYSTPVRVNQDAKEGDADQFQPWMAVTEGGQLNIMYFDRRNDPTNYYIDTYLSRSNDGGVKFNDVRVTQRLWDPAVNPPISVSGEFIGDYQGIVADDKVAIPFWNDTQANQLSGAEHSPWQEVWSARVGDTPAQGGPCGADKLSPLSAIAKRKRVTVKVRGKKVKRYRPAYRASRRSVKFAGTSQDRDCRLIPSLPAAEAAIYGKVSKVEVSLGRIVRGHTCSYLRPTGRFSRARNCRLPIFAFRAKVRYDATRHRTTWTFNRRFKPRLPKGRWFLDVRGTDPRGNLERGTAKARRLLFRIK